MNEHLIGDMQQNQPNWTAIIISSCIGMVIVLAAVYLVHMNDKNKLYDDSLVPCFTKDDETGFKAINKIEGKDRTHCIPCTKANNIYEKRVCGMSGKTK